MERPAESFETQLLSTFQEYNTALDITAVTKEQLGANRWPTPVVWIGKTDLGIVHKPDGSKDFLLLRQDAYEAGLLVTAHNQIRISCVPPELLARCVNYILPSELASRILH